MSTWAADDRGAWWAYKATTDDIDLQKSVSLIKELPIKKYEMSHDTIQGRVHYGVYSRKTRKLYWRRRTAKWSLEKKQYRARKVA